MLSKVCQLLRDIGALINQVTLSNENYVGKIQLLCRQYSSLYALEFPQHFQLTVWTMGYVIPYHTKKL